MLSISRTPRQKLSPPTVERLKFTSERIINMAEGVREVAALPDPVGAEIECLKPPRGFDLRKNSRPYWRHWHYL